MVRKLLPFLLAFLLLPAIALADQSILDHAGLFTDADVQKMQTFIQRIEDKHQVDMVILTTNEVPDDYSEEMWRIRSFADDFYDQGGYGMGEDFSGMLILLDMNNRALWLSTGGVMIEYINDSREESILDAGYTDLRMSNYGSAMIYMLARVEYYMDKGREEGTFLYDEVTGQRLSGIYNALTTAEQGVAALAGIAVAFMVYMSVGGSYSLIGSTYSYDRGSNAAVSFTRDDEVFVRQFTRRTPRSTGSSSGGSSGGRSGGSGVHRSSGGRSHGGGGRRF